MENKIRFLMVDTTKCIKTGCPLIEAVTRLTADLNEERILARRIDLPTNVIKDVLGKKLSVHSRKEVIIVNCHKGPLSSEDSPCGKLQIENIKDN